MPHYTGNTTCLSNSSTAGIIFLHELLLFRMCGWLFILCMYVNIYESFHAGNVADICIKYEWQNQQM